MEPMVVCALGIVVYCGYLTVKDFVADFRQEGFLARSTAKKCGKDKPSIGVSQHLSVPRSRRTTGHPNRVRPPINTQRSPIVARKALARA